MSEDFVGGRNVVSIVDTRGETMRFPVLRDVETYWNALRGARPMPNRSEIDPRRIRTALGNAFIVERLARNIGRFRVAGTHLGELMGMDVRGMPLTSLFLPEARPPVGDVLGQVFDAPAKAWLTLAGDRGLGKPEMDACLLLLPLRSDEGTVTRALGCLATHGRIGRTPRRFDLRNTLVTPILADGTVKVPDMAPDDWARSVPAAVCEPVNGLAESIRSFRPSPHRPDRTEKPYLYVVKRDDS